MLHGFLKILPLMVSISAVASSSPDEIESPLAGSGSPLGVLYFLIAFTLGCLTLKILSRYAPDLPYTVVVFLEGLCLAVLAEKNIISGELQRATKLWLGIDPHLFLLLFLPVLLFNECMELDTQLVKKIFLQAVVLATIGVLMSVVVIGLAQYYLIAPSLNLSSSWDLFTSLSLGSILSATDPVAVVTLLHHLGVSPVLTNQVSGESILNDGTAMVVYTLFADLETGVKYTPMEVIAFLMRMCLLGPLIGVLVGALALVCLSRANRTVGQQGHIDSTIQIGVTIIAAYGSYYIADEVAHSSGVLAVSFAG
ncbi:Son of sevenless 1 [Perkinsus chesapeaki]|uniref:Son of sevenless 1 n=1 Tax=Perkinsus chesapeaki TaxID=330153 RepID=A0A7J6LSQ1_PERCH|nr:Son of sevenless 1 [Perkinsus chesapeaki]